MVRLVFLFCLSTWTTNYLLRLLYLFIFRLFELFPHVFHLFVFLFLFFLIANFSFWVDMFLSLCLSSFFVFVFLFSFVFVFFTVLQLFFKKMEISLPCSLVEIMCLPISFMGSFFKNGSFLSVFETLFFASPLCFSLCAQKKIST